jgi:hypothetical protein
VILVRRLLKNTVSEKVGGRAYARAGCATPSRHRLHAVVDTNGLPERAQLLPSPLASGLLMTAIAIKLESRGPIFICEPQFGPRNRMIQVFKFRSVTTRAKTGIRQRTAWISLVLGGTGLDQLPQLFNVLRGEMPLAALLRAIGRDGVFFA